MNRLLFCTLFVFSLLIGTTVTVGQHNVAFTIDDVPNTTEYKMKNFLPTLLFKLDRIRIPVAAFINEGNVFKTDSVEKNFSLLNQWAKRDYVTLGNHTYSHLRYSEAGIDAFEQDIIKGESIIRKLARLYDKPLAYFRFPYNDLGEDSIQHSEIRKFLEQASYTLTPFTIESCDYLFNDLYTYYSRNGQHDKAAMIANGYITTTLKFFDYFDSLSFKQYGRYLNQIYM